MTGCLPGVARVDDRHSSRVDVLLDHREMSRPANVGHSATGVPSDDCSLHPPTCCRPRRAMALRACRTPLSEARMAGNLPTGRHMSGVSSPVRQDPVSATGWPIYRHRRPQWPRRPSTPGCRSHWPAARPGRSRAVCGDAVTGSSPNRPGSSSMDRTVHCAPVNGIVPPRGVPNWHDNSSTRRCTDMRRCGTHAAKVCTRRRIDRGVGLDRPGLWP